MASGHVTDATTNFFFSSSFLPHQTSNGNATSYDFSLNSSTSFSYPLELFLPPPLSSHLLSILTSLYVLVIVAAVAANALVILVVVRGRMLGSFTDTFILSLGVSDLLVASLNMPTRLLSTVDNEWRLGLEACKLTEYLQGMTIINNILTLTAIAVDRYLVICREQLYRRVKGRKWTAVGLLLVWASPVLAVSPQLAVTGLAMRVKREATGAITGLAWVCVETFSKQDDRRHVYTFTLAACFYLLPLSIMGACHGAIVRKLWARRSVAEVLANSRLNAQSGLARRRRVTAMLVTLVMAFTLLWLPFFSASLYVEFGGHSYLPSVRAARAFLQLIGYSTCCVNPVIYSFFSRRFQDNFCEFFCRSRPPRVVPARGPQELDLAPTRDRQVRANLFNTANPSSSLSPQMASKAQTSTTDGNKDSRE